GLEKRDAWQDVKTIVQYRTFRTEKGKETGQRQTPHDARRTGFGFPVSGVVLRVNADALGVVDLIFFPYYNKE
ncbi:MAG: hypothetical protein LBQ88_17495, partial [Treponema sp.]|nr:hypothetical protein [Treponema sp.]